MNKVYSSSVFKYNFEMKKTIPALCLLLLCCVQLFAHDFMVDGIYYNIIDTDVVAVTHKSDGVNSYSGTVIIPESVNYEGRTYQVTTIGDEAFYASKCLKAVSMFDGITIIGNHAFWGCDSLETIKFSDALVSIGGAAFVGCKQLQEVDLPTSLKIIGDEAFYGCESLTSVLVQSADSIGHHAFCACTGLTEATILSSLKNIEKSLFHSCEKLKSVQLPNTVELIKDCAFTGCKSLKTFVIPDNVMSLGYQAFCNSGLKNLTIGISLDSIAMDCFAGCHIQEIYALPKSPPKCGVGAFSRYDATLYVPEGSEASYTTASPWKYFETKPLPTRIDEIDKSETDGIVYTIQGFGKTPNDSHFRGVYISNGKKYVRY